MRAAAVLALLGTLASAAGAAGPAPESASGARIEARSATLLAVGTVHGDRMIIHLSRVADNAPVRDAVVAVLFRGGTHATVAETDGSYSLQSPDLRLAGAAAVQFQVTEGAVHEELNGTLKIADEVQPTHDTGNSRQLGWWVLNFAVCIGFLWLWRRRKTAQS